MLQDIIAFHNPQELPHSVDRPDAFHEKEAVDDMNYNMSAASDLSEVRSTKLLSLIVLCED